MEEGKVACEDGLDEGGPCEVAEDGGGSEGIEEGQNARSAKQAGVGVGERELKKAKGAYNRSNKSCAEESISIHCASTLARCLCHQLIMTAPSASLGALTELRT